MPLHAASSARGLVTFSSERGPLRTITLNDELEMRAGQVPFRTGVARDVLPIDTQAFYKCERENASQALIDYYAQWYASYLGTPADTTQLRLYDIVALPPRATTGIDLAHRTINGSLWIALLARKGKKVEEARKEVLRKAINLGLVP